MSKKHFEALAAKINERVKTLRNSDLASPAEKGTALAAIEIIVGDLAEVCADANPRFDTRRFLTACGIN
jgi:hypothetical protein